MNKILLKRKLLERMAEFYRRKEEQEARLRKLVREAKPKLERNGTSRGITCNAMLNDIIRVTKQMNSKDTDDVYFANWMLERYAAFFEQKPTGKYKVGSLSTFVKEDLMKQEAILQAELDRKKEEEKAKQESEQKIEDNPFTDEEIEKLLEGLL